MKNIYGKEQIIKSGFYLDFLFKNFIFILYEKFIVKNFLYFVDKYLTEIIFFSLKSLSNNFFFLINAGRALNFNKFVRIMIVVSMQSLLMFIL